MAHFCNGLAHGRGNIIGFDNISIEAPDVLEIAMKIRFKAIRQMGQVLHPYRYAGCV